MPGYHSHRRTISMRSTALFEALGRVCVVATFAVNFAFAEDGATLYKQLCATCHDTGLERAPSRDAFRGMSPERVLAAMESGPMISMSSGRTGVERREIAEFVTDKKFGQALSTTPSAQAMCRPGRSEERRVGQGGRTRRRTEQ